MAQILRIEQLGDAPALVVDDGRRIRTYPTAGNYWQLYDAYDIDDVVPDPGDPGNPGTTPTPDPGNPTNPDGWQWPFQYSRYVLDDPRAQYGMRINPVTGLERLHAGLDFGGGGIDGLPIPCASKGTVSAKGLDARGNYLIVDHAGGFQTHYFHMVSESPLSVGAAVTKGQALGNVGSTGQSTGPHLHWETHDGGESFNPRDFMRARGVPES
jgi:murein DD-endopeptidase MepM/ murein hydrolase activator NlpD